MGILGPKYVWIFGDVMLNPTTNPESLAKANLSPEDLLGSFAWQGYDGSGPEVEEVITDLGWKKMEFLSGMGFSLKFGKYLIFIHCLIRLHVRYC
ncbi:hypothetical protein M1146_05805 [Patescibacteria group bacterium]|nr:hypothetical protein [Patescibacteria group bacterium]